MKLKYYMVTVNYRKNTQYCCDGGMIAQMFTVWAYDKVNARELAREEILINKHAFRLPKSAYVVGSIHRVNCRDYGFTNDDEMYIDYCERMLY